MEGPASKTQSHNRIAIALPTILAFLTPALLSIESGNQQQDTSILVLAHLTIIDVADGTERPDMDVLILGDRIRSIGPAGTVSIPQGASVVYASGMFLIPGLWDMHVHTLRKDRIRLFPVFLANGILGVRDMGIPVDELDELRLLKRRVEDGSLLGPWIVAAGPLLDGPKPMFPDISLAISNEHEGRQAVGSLALKGVDFIKVYTSLPRDAYFGVADEARRLGIPFAGHVPDSISPAEASDAGQKSIEHLTQIWPACSTKRPVVAREVTEAHPEHSARAGDSTDSAEIGEYDQQKAEALFWYSFVMGRGRCPRCPLCGFCGVVVLAVH